MMIKRSSRRPNPLHQDSGYALLLVMFFTTLMLIGIMVAAPAWRTEIRREKELEMIWRGKQYVHAVKLYYRRTGRFPTSIEDLSKPKLGSIRFLRKAYKDPMNKEDGSWRLIYVGPAGQLIGTKKLRTVRLPGSLTHVPGPEAKAGGTPSTSGTVFSTNMPSSLGSSPASGLGQATDSKNPEDKDKDKDKDTMSDSSSGATPTIIGGNIIGVGSKVEHPSVITYEDATNYRLFEFIWDPSKDTVGAGGTAIQGVSPAQGPAGGGFRNRQPRQPLPNPPMPPLQGPSPP